MTTQGLTRHELSHHLKISGSSVNRLIAAGLRPVGTRGPAKLYSPTAARAALRRAAAAGPGTEYGAALLSLFLAQAEEARAREGELRRQHIHESEWVVGLRLELAAVREVLAEWLTTAPDRVAAIARPGGPRVFPGDDPRAIGYAVQELVSRPLLEAIAARVNALPPPPAPAGSSPGRRRPTTIAEARAALLRARGAVAQLRADIKSDRAWRPRPAVERGLGDARANARDTIWTGLPATVLRGRADDRRGTMPSVLQAIAADCGEALEAALPRRPGGRRRR